MSIERAVAFVLGPIITAGSAWVCGAVSKYGLHLDPTEVAATATAGAVAAGGGVVTWLKGRQNPELLRLEQEAQAIAGKLSPALRAELEAFVRQEVVHGQEAIVKVITDHTSPSTQAASTDGGQAPAQAAAAPAPA